MARNGGLKFLGPPAPGGVFELQRDEEEEEEEEEANTVETLQLLCAPLEGGAQ